MKHATLDKIEKLEPGHMTAHDIVSQTFRTIKAHVDRDGLITLACVGLDNKEIQKACDDIKAMVAEDDDTDVAWTKYGKRGRQ